MNEDTFRELFIKGEITVHYDGVFGHSEYYCITDNGHHIVMVNIDNTRFEPHDSIHDLYLYCIHLQDIYSIKYKETSYHE